MLKKKKKTCPSATFSTANTTWTGMSSKPDLRGERLASDSAVPWHISIFKTKKGEHFFFPIVSDFRKCIPFFF
jgi:hypothetical protein